MRMGGEEETSFGPPWRKRGGKKVSQGSHFTKSKIVSLAAGLVGLSQDSFEAFSVRETLTKARHFKHCGAAHGLQVE